MRKFNLTKGNSKSDRPRLKDERPPRVTKDEATLLRDMRSATEVSERTGLPEKVTVVQAARKANEANPGDRIPVVVNKREFEAMRHHFGEPREHPETGVMQFGYGGADQGHSMGNADGAGSARGDSRGGGGGRGNASVYGGNGKDDTAAAVGGSPGSPGNPGSSMDGGVRIDRVKKGLPGDPANIEGNWNEWKGPKVENQRYGDLEFRDNDGNIVGTPTTKVETPVPLSLMMQLAGMLAPQPFGIGMKIGDYMGDLVGEDQAAVDLGLKKSTRMDDPSMGRVDNIAGQGIGGFGNAASDDRAENANGLGGGMSGGGGGDGINRSLSNQPDGRLATLIRNGILNAENAEVFGVPLSRYNAVASQVYPSSPSPASAAADSAQQSQPYSPLNITGSSSVTTWPWTNTY